MKKIILILVAMITVATVSAQSSKGQKFAYLYSEKVFKSMPEYDKAVKDLESYSKTAQQQVDAKLAEAKKMYEEFVSIENRLSAENRTTLREAIVSKEREANKYQEDFYSENGNLAKRQKELMAPIEKRVLDAVNAIAVEGGYDMIFDLSTVKTTIYQSASLDLTNAVIERVKK